MAQSWIGTICERNKQIYRFFLPAMSGSSLALRENISSLVLCAILTMIPLVAAGKGSAIAKLCTKQASQEGGEGEEGCGDGVTAAIVVGIIFGLLILCACLKKCCSSTSAVSPA